MPMALRPWMTVSVLAAFSCWGCASGDDKLRAEQERQKLHAAMQASVGSRTTRDEQSQLLADAVEDAGLEGLDRPRVRAAFGPGKACEIDVCRSLGFAP